MMPRPQFRLRSLFILTALVAVGCLGGQLIVREIRMVLWRPEHDGQKHDDYFLPDTRSRPVLSTASEYKQDFDAARAAQFSAPPPTE